MHGARAWWRAVRSSSRSLGGLVRRLRYSWQVMVVVLARVPVTVRNGA